MKIRYSTGLQEAIDGGSPERIKEALDELLTSDWHTFSLDEECRQGGSPEEPDFEITNFVHDAKRNEIEVFCEGSFTESYYQGCRDMSWTSKYSGTLSFKIDLEDLSVFSVEREFIRQPESDDD